MRVRFDPFDDELEGVMFNADIDGNGQISNVTIDPAFDNDYWDNFNKAKYLKKAEQHLADWVSEYNTAAEFIADTVGPGCSIQEVK